MYDDDNDDPGLGGCVTGTRTALTTVTRRPPGAGPGPAPRPSSGQCQ